MERSQLTWGRPTIRLSGLGMTAFIPFNKRIRILILTKSIISETLMLLHIQDQYNTVLLSRNLYVGFQALILLVHFL